MTSNAATGWTGRFGFTRSSPTFTTSSCLPSSLPFWQHRPSRSTRARWSRAACASVCRQADQEDSGRGYGCYGPHWQRQETSARRRRSARASYCNQSSVFLVQLHQQQQQQQLVAAQRNPQQSCPDIHAGARQVCQCMPVPCHPHAHSHRVAATGGPRRDPAPPTAPTSSLPLLCLLLLPSPLPALRPSPSSSALQRCSVL